MCAPTLLLGLGNPLRSDDGIGVRVAQCLAAHPELPAGVEVRDLGTRGLALLHLLAGRRTVWLIDCARMGTPPGTLRRFAPRAARSRRTGGGASPHEVDLLRVLSLAAHLGEAPGDVVVIGIEPETVVPGRALSACLAERLPEYVAQILNELHGCPPAPDGGGAPSDESVC